MTKLTKTEKAYNEWWLSRFDYDYKTICLFNGNNKIQEYTTANKRYSDKEDAKCAFWVADQMGLSVTCVSVDGKKFTRSKGHTIRYRLVPIK